MGNNNMQNNNPYSNTYNAGWRNHPNLGWGNNNQQRLVQGQNYQPPQEKKPNLEKMLETLTANTVVLQAETKSFMAETHTNFKNHRAAIHNLEVQVGNLSAQLANRAQGSMPSDTVKNPKEQVNAINLRSGKVLKPARTPIRRTTEPEEVSDSRRAGEEKPCPHCGCQTAG